MTGANVGSVPGRVTVIGEHTDYNFGIAIAIATSERLTAAVWTNDDGIVEVRSSALGVASCRIGATRGAPPFAILAASLARHASVAGARIEVDSSLPVGAGLASSAAYAVALALALGIDGDYAEVARTCQAAEAAAGSDVGLLDQLAVLAARRGALVDLDFEIGTTTTVPLPEAIGLTVVDSGVRRHVATSAYSVRRDECALAARALGPLGAARLGELPAIRDPTVRRRARHVVTECARVREARVLFAQGDLEGIGAVLDDGHRSLRDDFEVSTPQVEAAREELCTQPGVVGTRLTGAGFGGCILVAHDPTIRIDVRGRWSTRLRGGDGASVSAAS